MATIGVGSPILDDARIQVLELKAGDTLVLSFPGPLSENDGLRIKADLSSKFPLANCLVIGDGGQLSVIREEGHDAEQAT